MDDLKHLFENNRRWVGEIIERDPGFFRRLAKQQTPEYLWIGCSDSRVPANQIIGLMPGEVFVHRNIANIVPADDANCLSVIQYAVDILQVRHIIVCGHFGCGGVQAVLENRQLGLSDSWLGHVRAVRDEHKKQLDSLDEPTRFKRLCQINVIEQVTNVVRTKILCDAWSRQQTVIIHGWIYSIENGLLSDLGVSVSQANEVTEKRIRAISKLQ